MEVDSVKIVHHLHLAGFLRAIEFRFCLEFNTPLQHATHGTALVLCKRPEAIAIVGG